jgi:two-component system response regulator AtoC
MLGSARILVVDDELASVESTLRTLEMRCRARTRCAPTLRTALALLRRERVDVIVTELRLPDATGTAVIRSLHAVSGAPIVVATRHGSEEIAADVTRIGARRYVSKRDGFLSDLTNVVEDVLGTELLRQIDTASVVGHARAALRLPDPTIVAESPEMRHVIQLSARAATSRATVLIEGETGTGKEVVARAVHALGPNPAAPFRVQNCAALPETLLEAELFGHVRGAFTSADRDRAGLFLDARDGTVFLDEVGDAPLGLQAKLLRVLQEGEVKPVGSDRAQHSRARIIAATHRRLEHEIATGRFRSDLFYRLSVFPITVPALRERPDDIAPLTTLFLERFQRSEAREVGPVTSDAFAALRAYAWPGNVRELEHEIHRLVLATPQGLPIDVHSLAVRIRMAADEVRGEPLDHILRRVELAVLRDRIRHAPSKAAAARSLGITREALYWKLRRLEAAGTDET